MTSTQKNVIPYYASKKCQAITAPPEYIELKKTKSIPSASTFCLKNHQIENSDIKIMAPVPVNIPEKIQYKSKNYNSQDFTEKSKHTNIPKNIYYVPKKEQNENHNPIQKEDRFKYVEVLLEKILKEVHYLRQEVKELKSKNPEENKLEKNSLNIPCQTKEDFEKLEHNLNADPIIASTLVKCL